MNNVIAIVRAKVGLTCATLIRFVCLSAMLLSTGASADLPKSVRIDQQKVLLMQSLSNGNCVDVLKNMEMLQALTGALTTPMLYLKGDCEYKLGKLHIAKQTLESYFRRPTKNDSFYIDALNLYTTLENQLRAIEEDVLAKKANLAQKQVDAELQSKATSLAESIFSQTNIEMVPVEPGCFLMGSPVTEEGRDGDEQLHQVCLSKGYLIGKYEVTQGQWREIMNDNPSYFQNCGAKCPVEKVSWFDTKAFVAKLSEKTGLNFRLPTEAEWEYACRAGESQRFCGGDQFLGALGWYDANSGRKTHPVGLKEPNNWGIYDMVGNVWEWVQDWKGDFTLESKTDPSGPEEGSIRIYRGCGWYSLDRFCRAANRGSFSAPDDRRYSLGFRLAITVDQ